MLDVLAYKAVDVRVRNVLENADFSSGLSEWRPISGLIATNADGELKITNLGDSVSPYKLFQSTSLPIDNVKYVAVEMLSTSAQDGIRLGSSPVFKRHSGNGSYEKLSIVGSGSAAVRILDSPRTGDITADPVYIRRPLCVDLTATFGTGNEPTAEQMDALLSQFADSWFMGSKNLFNARAFMAMYFAKIRELENAIASMGGS